MQDWADMHEAEVEEERPRKRQRLDEYGYEMNTKEMEQQEQQPHTVLYVAPTLVGRPLALWSSPRPDFLWLVLSRWELPQLTEILLAFHACSALLPRNDGRCDTSFWDAHFVPLLLPGPVLRPSAQAFLKLRKAGLALLKAAKEADTIITLEENSIHALKHNISIVSDSMRLAILLAVVVDYRARTLVMVDDERTHQRFHSRPPERSRLWTFFECGGGNVLRDYCTHMEQLIFSGAPLKECVAYTQQVVEDVRIRWVTCRPPHF